MLKTGLEFAPGTTDDSRKLVGKLFQPTEILSAYKQGRATFKTGDLVLVASESDPSGISVEPRTSYLKRLRESLGIRAKQTMPALVIAQKSAHGVMSLPFESDAFWFVIVRGAEIPVMNVIYTTPYEVSAAN